MRSIALLTLLACWGSPPDPAVTQVEDDATLEQLRALGYVSFSEDVADTTLEGVVTLDATRVQPGYRLYVSAKDCVAELIDVEGRVVRRWSEGWRCYNWSNAELGADGALLVPTRITRRFWDRPSDGETHHLRQLLRYGFDGRERMRSKVPVHHDTERQPDSSIVALTAHRRQLPSVRKGAWVLDNGLVWLNAEGELVRELSLHDVLAENDIGFRFSRVGATVNEDGERLIDLLHANAVEVFDRPALAERHALYAPGNILVTVRHQDAVVILDPAREALVWAWGRGELEGPHDAQLLDNGHLLIFDNGMERHRSRVVEVDPVSREVVWTYDPQGESAFFTRGRGSAQRLPNGNTLLADSNNGEAREVTPEGEIVWRFYNPRYDSDGHRGALVRMKHYPAEVIEPLLSPAGE